MATIPEALAIAIEHHRAGRLQVAGTIYRQILQWEPDNADTLHLLGLVHAQSGEHGAAIASIRRAVSIRPDWAEAQANLGNSLREQGNLDEAVLYLRRALLLKPDDAAAQHNLGLALDGQGNRDEAIACYRRALELKPDFAEAHANLGHALKGRGDRDEAIACYRRALELRPHDAAAHFNMGMRAFELGKPAEALAYYRRAVELEPAHAAAQNNLGIALSDVGRPEEAIACYRRAAELRPDFAEPHHNLGIALGALGRPDQAVISYRRAVALRPDHAGAYNNLGNILLDLGNPEEALACYRRVLELRPDDAEAHSNLGNALKGRGDLEEAIACYRGALALRPDYAEAFNNLGNAFRDRGELDEAIACYRRALELNADHATAHSNLLCTLHYRPGVAPAALAEAHAEYDRRHAEPLHRAATRRERFRTGDVPLRLGFISPDLGRHPVGSFLVRVLENLGRVPHETFCYSDRAVKDGLTHRLQAAATHWRDVFGMNHERLAEQVRADRINILFDLAGHTARNRLLVFARKPAPVQITWIGYEGTTGLAAMDYLLADDLMIPPGTERYYRETVLRMPDGYLCYDPPEAAPPVGPPPSLTNGFVTFGSFSNPAKITPDVVAVWARILRGAPDARLLMKYRGLGDRSVRQRFQALFAAHGVSLERVDLRPWSSYADYLATYQEVDVTLDPFPFSGSATTCESLWMGVPVITCPGETFASRHSLRHLSSVGLTDTIATDETEYVNLAIRLTRDPSRLVNVRPGLRECMAASPMCDGDRFARHLISLLYGVLGAVLDDARVKR